MVLSFIDGICKNSNDLKMFLWSFNCRIREFEVIFGFELSFDGHSIVVRQVLGVFKVI